MGRTPGVQLHVRKGEKGGGTKRKEKKGKKKGGKRSKGEKQKKSKTVEKRSKLMDSQINGGKNAGVARGGKEGSETRGKWGGIV